MKTKTEQKIWSLLEDSILKETYEQFQHTSKKWKKVASFLKGKTPKQCYSRYRQINPNFKQGLFYKGLDEGTTQMFGYLTCTFKADEKDGKKKNNHWVIIVIFIIIFILLHSQLL